jgi:hypothetical protein
MEYLIEIVKSILPSLIVGVLLLRYIESTKANVAKQSDFHKRWADEFFSCCQQFMQALERELALLNVLGKSTNLNEELKTEILEEISRLHPKLSELELRIRRNIVFAPVSGNTVTRTAKDCISLIHQFTRSLQGDLDEIIDKMNEFNIASRNAHEEMLGLRGVKSGNPDT